MAATELSVPHRSKPIAGALALFVGFAGAHRLYLGARGWWLYPLLALPAMGIALRADPWFRHPGFFVATIVVLVAMLEAIVICLTPDARWDARHNPGSAQHSSSGWAVVLIAIAALMLGVTLMMSVLAIALETWFESMTAR
ncbi:MAG: NINE protein [Burkholderiales bacterium]|nr:MAG: NINE protein [Burkholderiales bacterium]RPH66441.1 MAG: NINE protein [Burkholderiales bacterium]